MVRDLRDLIKIKLKTRGFVHLLFDSDFRDKLWLHCKKEK